MVLFKAATPLFFGMLALTLAAAPGMAQGHGNRGGGERSPSRGTASGGQSSDRNRGAGNSGGNLGSNFSGDRGGGQRSVAPAGRYGGGQQFGGGRDRDRDRGERREYRGGSGYYRGNYGGFGGYRRSGYGGYYSGGFYLGFGRPYYDSYYDPYYSPRYVYDGYGYDRGYTYEPEYEYGPDRNSSYGPAYAPSPCTVDAYDQYGRRIPNPNCNPNYGNYNNNTPRYEQQQDNRQYQQYPQQQLNPNYDRR